MNSADTQMYIDGYRVKPVSDTPYSSLWGGFLHAERVLKQMESSNDLCYDDFVVNAAEKIFKESTV